MSGLELAVIGNCSFGALIDRKARLVWACLPRFDSDPVFCALLGGLEPADGFFDLDLVGLSRSEQAYRRNSAVLETRLFDDHGGAIEIIDYAPRFRQFERVFRPHDLIRRVSVLSGSPRVRVRVRPRSHYGDATPETTRGSNHIRYVMPGYTLRLTTDAPIAYIAEQIPFILEGTVAFVVGVDESLQAPLADIAREWLEKTDLYWQDWCRGLSLPFEWQDEVIRAAITLKLCSYDDSGAIIAAMTTSIPEAANTRRNWDYRYCWLRDAHFVVGALNRLGATATMERYLGYIANIVATAADGALQPVFGVLREERLEEREAQALAGYRGMGPVRIGNDAYRQTQNDGYGSVVLACTQSFFDRRLLRAGTVPLFHRLEQLGAQALLRWDQPDAGLWELRTRAAVHTYSSIMCWVACDRLGKIADRLGLDARRDHWQAHAARLKTEILARAWNDRLTSFAASFGGSDVDASLLLMPSLGFIAADDPRFLKTLAYIEKRLRRGRTLFRYAGDDGFGEPTTAFIACTFWYIDALAVTGRAAEARELFAAMLDRRTALGLLSEDIDPATGELWGNFPQTYSMVGLIQTAMRLSRPWEGVF